MPLVKMIKLLVLFLGIWPTLSLCLCKTYMFLVLLDINSVKIYTILYILNIKEVAYEEKSNNDKP